MRAALLYGREDLRIQDVAVPEIGANEVLLKVMTAAVCGTDVRMYKNGYKGISEDSPLVLGHELSGFIAKKGRNVHNYQEGARVAVAPNMGCGTCDWCVGGNTQLCSNYRAFGINIYGGFAEYMRIPEDAVRQGNIIEIAPEVSFEEAAIAEPLSCVYNAFLRYRILPGEVALIIGAGPIGLMHAKLARMAGAATVILNDLSEERLAICKKVDDSLVTISGSSLEGRVMEISRGRGVDVCVTACPSPEAQALALRLAAVNGRVLFFGGLPADRAEVALDTNMIHYKQITISGTTRSSLTHFRKILEIIAGGIVQVKDLITGSYKIEEIETAFGNVLQSSGLKNMIYTQVEH